MAKFLIFCFLVLLITIYEGQTLSKDCPLSSKMTSCSPKCKDDTECFGQKCCPNICNAKSCTQANQASGNSGYKGSSSGGAGVYCAGVKCNSFEKCVMDRSTKREKCSRQ